MCVGRGGGGEGHPRKFRYTNCMRYESVLENVLRHQKKIEILCRYIYNYPCWSPHTKQFLKFLSPPPTEKYNVETRHHTTHKIPLNSSGAIYVRRKIHNIQPNTNATYLLQRGDGLNNEGGHRGGMSLGVRHVAESRGRGKLRPRRAHGRLAPRGGLNAAARPIRLRPWHPASFGYQARSVSGYEVWLHFSPLIL